ncbi:hypothetical protein Krac_2773 [Ktedonobacter racemifer DSM 44963]|uniref:Uncharacterized protein n=1 Tax=Ktedonobacter racemifer DSM 44963 TaxID=485913 RepID=D6TZL2_KTERA|nr:hypothetical protein Krac_2773 [Ktedonobacter racemifer DSM 44963]
MKLIPAGATVKDRLRTPIVACLMPTTRTGLRGMTRINAFNHHSLFLPFVDNEAVQLRKGPGMQLTLSFTFAMSDSFSNIGQVLKHNCCSRGYALHDAFGEHMVTVPVEKHLLTRQLFEMPFGRRGSFGLKFATETERTAVNLFPVARAKEVTVGSHSRTIQAQVHTNNRVIGLNNRFGNIDHDMQPPFPFAVDQVSSSNVTPTISLTEMRNGKGKSHFALRGRNANRLCFPIEGVGVNIVTNRTLLRGRATNRLEERSGFPLFLCVSNLFRIGRFLLGFPGESTAKRFGGFDPSLNEQVTHQTRTQGFRLVVGGMMKPDTVLLAMLPTIDTHMIVGNGKLHQRFLQDVGLFCIRLKLNPHRSIHAQIIPYM